MVGMTSDMISKSIGDSIGVKQKILADTDLLGTIRHVAEACITAYQGGGRVLLAGNGGSAADAQHIAAELVGRYSFDRPALSSIALTTDSSMITAIGNDYGYDHVFLRQLEANGRKGDVFIGISTSGHSPNVIAALKRSRELGIVAIGLTGQDGAMMQPCSDYCICIPSDSTPRIQESHIMVGHIICEMVEASLFGGQEVR
jgi:D-sedoheptulose 7-phosphate isomerase